MDTTKEFKDFTGRTVKVGDCITYPGRTGSSMWMNVGRVKDIEEKRNWYNRENVVVKVERVKKLRDFDVKWTKKYQNNKAGDIVTYTSTIYCIDRVVRVDNLTIEELEGK